MKLHLPRLTIRLTICAAALLLSNRFCFADTCPSDEQPTMPPSQELLAHAYQPPDGDILHRYRFVPSTGGPTFPTVLMLPPDVLTYHTVPTALQVNAWRLVIFRQLISLFFKLSTVLHRDMDFCPVKTLLTGV